MSNKYRLEYNWSIEAIINGRYFELSSSSIPSDHWIHEKLYYSLYPHVDAAGNEKPTVYFGDGKFLNFDGICCKLFVSPVNMNYLEWVNNPTNVTWRLHIYSDPYTVYSNHKVLNNQPVFLLADYYYTAYMPEDTGYALPTLDKELLEKE